QNVFELAGFGERGVVVEISLRRGHGVRGETPRSARGEKADRGGETEKLRAAAHASGPSAANDTGCALAGARQTAAGQGSKEDQSVARANSSSGGKRFRKLNAKSVGPCSARCARRFLASSTEGIWPAGTHQSARTGESIFSNQSLRLRKTSAWAPPYA